MFGWDKWGKDGEMDGLALYVHKGDVMTYHFP